MYSVDKCNCKNTSTRCVYERTVVPQTLQGSAKLSIGSLTWEELEAYNTVREVVHDPCPLCTYGIARICTTYGTYICVHMMHQSSSSTGTTSCACTYATKNMYFYKYAIVLLYITVVDYDNQQIQRNTVKNIRIYVRTKIQLLMLLLYSCQALTYCIVENSWDQCRKVKEMYMCRR